MIGPSLGFDRMRADPHPETRVPLAILDLAWPDGMQRGLSRPVALLVDERADVEEAANRAGFLFFTDVDAFRAYVLRDILAAEPVMA